MDEQQRKALKAKFAAEQRQKIIDSLPFSAEMFHELFDYLDQHL